MPTYTTKYFFELQVRGEKAVQAARRYRQEISAALQGSAEATTRLVSAERALESQLARTNATISSQTRRLSYYMRRLDEVGGHADQLASKLQSLYATMSAGGLNAFDGLIKGAQSAADQIVGRSIIPDMVDRVKAQYTEMSQAGQQAFAQVTSAAEKSNATILALPAPAPAARALQATNIPTEHIEVLADWMEQNLPTAQKMQGYFDRFIASEESVSTGRREDLQGQVASISGRSPAYLKELEGAWGTDYGSGLQNAIYEAASKAFDVAQGPAGRSIDYQEFELITSGVADLTGALQAVQAVTQAEIKALGYSAEETIKLYRGAQVRSDAFLPEVGTWRDPTTARSLESWSTSPQTAMGFSAQLDDSDPAWRTSGYLLQTEAQVKDIVGIFSAGLGAMFESELVLLGPQLQAQVLASFQGKADTGQMLLEPGRDIGGELDTIYEKLAEKRVALAAQSGTGMLQASRIAPTARAEEFARPSYAPPNVEVASFPVTKDLYQRLEGQEWRSDEIVTRLAEASKISRDMVNNYLDSQSIGLRPSTVSTAASRALGITGGPYAETLRPSKDTSEEEDLVRAVSVETQQLLRSVGIGANDLVNVYRGISLSAEKAAEFELGTQVGPANLGVAAESWTLDPRTAATFAKYSDEETPGVILGALVAAKDLISVATAGYGDVVEKEVLVSQDALRLNAPGVVGTIVGDVLTALEDPTALLTAGRATQLGMGPTTMLAAPGLSATEKLLDFFQDALTRGSGTFTEDEAALNKQLSDASALSVATVDALRESWQTPSEQRYADFARAAEQSALGTSPGVLAQPFLSGPDAGTELQITQKAQLIDGLLKLTQGTLRALDIAPDDPITLYRGTAGPSTQHADDPSYGRALQSWSLQIETARDFAMQNWEHVEDDASLVQKAEIAAKNIVSMFSSGMGSDFEHELIVDRKALEARPPQAIEGSVYEEQQLRALQAGAAPWVPQLEPPAPSKIAPTALLEDVSQGLTDMPFTSWPVTKALYQYLNDNEELSADVLMRLAESSQMQASEVRNYIDFQKGGEAYDVYGSPGTVSEAAGELLGITGGPIAEAFDKRGYDPKEVGLLKAAGVETQALFRSLGVGAEDLVHIYRGLDFDLDQPDEPRPEFGLGERIGPKYLGAAAESWTLDPETAAAFAGRMGEGTEDQGALLGALVAAKDILSIAGAGYGSISEKELLVRQDALRLNAPSVVGAYGGMSEGFEAVDDPRELMRAGVAAGLSEVAQTIGIVGAKAVQEQEVQIPTGSVPISLLADMAAGLTSFYRDVMPHFKDVTPFTIAAGQDVTRQLAQLSEGMETIRAIDPETGTSRFQLQGQWPYPRETDITALGTGIGLPIVGAFATRDMRDPATDPALLETAIGDIGRNIIENEGVLKNLGGYLKAVNVLVSGDQPHILESSSLGRLGAWQGVYADPMQEMYLQAKPDRDILGVFWHELGHTFAAMSARLNLPELRSIQSKAAEQVLADRYRGEPVATAITGITEGSGGSAIAQQIEENIAEHFGKYRQYAPYLQELTEGIERVGLTTQGRAELAQQPLPPGLIYGASSVDTVSAAVQARFDDVSTSQLNAINAKLFQLAEKQRSSQDPRAAPVPSVPQVAGVYMAAAAPAVAAALVAAQAQLPSPPLARLAPFYTAPSRLAPAAPVKPVTPLKPAAYTAPAAPPYPGQRLLAAPSRAQGAIDVEPTVVGRGGTALARTGGGTPVIDISKLYGGGGGGGGGGIRQIAGDVSDKGPGIMTFLQQFSQGLNQATMQYFGLRRLGYGFQSVGRGMERWGQGVIGQLSNASQAYLVFNKAATLAATAMELPIELQDELEEALRNTASALGTFSASEVAEGMRLWAAGTGQVVDTQEKLHAILVTTTSVQKLAAMNGVELGQTMATVGSILAEYGLEIEDVGAVTGVLNFVAAKTFANVNDVGAAFKMVGPVAASMGVSFTETAAALGLLSDANIKGSMAGRALRQLFLSLLDPTAATNEQMNELLGTNKELAESWKKLVFPKGEFIGLAKFIDLLAASTENFTQLQRNEALAVMATANELPSLITLVNAQIEARKEGINVLAVFEKSMLGVVDAETEAADALAGLDMGSTGAADLFEKQWNQIADSAANQADRVKQRWAAAMMGVGEATTGIALGPIEALVGVLENISAFVEKHPSIAGAAGVAAIAAVVSGKLLVTVGTIANAAANLLILKGAFAQFGGAVGAFQAAVSTFGTRSSTGGVAGALGRKVGGAGVAAAVLPALTIGALTAVAVGAAHAVIPTIGKALEGALDLEEPSVEQQKGQYAYAAMQGYRGTFEEFQTFTRVAVGETAAIAENAEDTAAAYDRARGNLAEGSTVSPASSVATVSMMPEGYKEALAEYQKFVDDSDELMQNYMDNVEDAQETRQDRMVDEVKDYYGRREDAAESHYDKLEAITEDGLDRRNAIIERANERAESAAESYEYKVSTSGSDYAYNQQKKEEDAVIRRQAIIERYNEWVIDNKQKLVQAEQAHVSKLGDMWEDYQREQERSREDHVDRLWDLVATRDARGMLREARDYKKAQKRRGEDYQRSVERENARWAKEQERQAQSEIKRKAELAKQLAAFDAAEARRKEKDAEAERRKLEKLQEAFEKQLLDIARDREKDLVKLDKATEKRRQDEKEDYADRLVDLEDAHSDRMEKINEQYEETLERQNDQHEKSLGKLEEQARETINMHIDAIEGITRETAQPWQDQVQALESWLGRQLSALRTFEGSLRQEKNTIIDLWAEMGAVYRAWQSMGPLPSFPGPIGGGPIGGLPPWMTPSPPGGGIAPPPEPPPSSGGGGGGAPPYVPPGGYIPSSISPALLENSYGFAAMGSAPVRESVVVQQTGWVFEGSMSDADKAWYKQAAKDAAFTAVAEVL